MLRIALYLVGIIVLALGITLNTKTNLGVSPIISIPYAVAQIFGYETGTAVFVAYLIFIVLRIVLLKGKFPPFQLLQVAASYLTSAFITIFDRVLPVPEQMGSRLLVFALAIGMIGAGRPVGIGNRHSVELCGLLLPGSSETLHGLERYQLQKPLITRL